MKLKLFTAAAIAVALAAGAPALANPMVGGAPMFVDRGHRPERRQLQGPHHPGRGGQGRGSGGDAGKPRTVHRLRADQRGLRRSAGGHGGHAAEAGEQGRAHRRPHLSRGRRPYRTSAPWIRRSWPATAWPCSRPSTARISPCAGRARTSPSPTPVVAHGESDHRQRLSEERRHHGRQQGPVAEIGPGLPVRSAPAGGLSIARRLCLLRQSEITAWRRALHQPGRA